jgi:phosphotransferase system HPr-like phosphotransfer protein
MKKIFFGVLLIVWAGTSTAQLLTGQWEGSISMGAPVWKLNIVHIGDSCFGISFDSDGANSYCRVHFSATYNAAKNLFKGGGLSFIERKFGHELFTVNLSYYKDKTGEYLRGTGRPKSVISKVFSLGIGFNAQLKKVSTQADTTAVAMQALVRLINKQEQRKPASLNKTDADAAAIVKKQMEPQVKPVDSVERQMANSIEEKKLRQAVVVSHIKTKADSVRIIIHDDGEIDGDMVTIFDNDAILIKNLLLSRTPFEKILYLPADGSKLVIALMAENEGSIPPNTAYMLVLADGERVEVKASSDRLSNAVIVIERAL